MKLYYLPGACSFVPHVALQWCGEPYEAEAVTREKIKSPEYLALNPQGSVPLLVEGDFALSQNIAIVSYLDQRYPDAKLFGSHTPQDKAKAMRWLTFFNSDVHKTFTPFFRPLPYAQDNEALLAEIRQHAQQTLLGYLAIANRHLEQHAFFGETLCVADVYLYIMLCWCQKIGVDFSHLSRLAPFMQRVEANAAVDAVREQEGLKGKSS